MANQRRAKRAKVDIYLNKILDEALHMARATDISPDGVWLNRLLEPKHEGKRVGLEFQLPGEREVIWAAGEVVRRGDRQPAGSTAADGSAIKFTAMADRFRRMIEAYVSRVAGNA